MSRSRGWCFTINNPTGWDIADLEKAIEATNYLCYGKEVGEEGTPHLQGYLRFQNPVSLKRVKLLLPRAHLEIQKGTVDQAIQYCEKDGEFLQYGERPKSGGKGTKDMWRRILAWAESGNYDAIKGEYPGMWILHNRKLLDLRRRIPRILNGELTNEWWVGKTGTGKSRRLWEMHPDHYAKSLNKWWDGYEDESIVAIEEMNPDAGKFMGSFIKIWADRYPFSPEVKGAHLKRIRPEKVIILSNYTIDECFEKVQDRDPIKRRFRVIEFHEIFGETLCL